MKSITIFTKKRFGIKKKFQVRVTTPVGFNCTYIYGGVYYRVCV